MSDQKKVVHEIKLSKPVGNMVFPEAMAELYNGSKIEVEVELRTPGYLDLRHHN